MYLPISLHKSVNKLTYFLTYYLVASVWYTGRRRVSSGTLNLPMLCLYSGVIRWQYSIGLTIKGSRVRLPLKHCWRNNLRQVVHTLVPLSPNSKHISWYRCKNQEVNGRLSKRCGLPSITLSVSSLSA